MKILKNKGRVVFVATSPSDPHDNCPRLIINEEINEIRDDYKGSIKVPKKLLYKIF